VKTLETPESLRERLRRLADLGEALPEFAADRARLVWLYREICRECVIVLRNIVEYWAQTLSAKLRADCWTRWECDPGAPAASSREGECGEGDEP
jgi:hypothetical protein